MACVWRCKRSTCFARAWARRHAAWRGARWTKALKYAKTREQFGKPLSGHQLIQEKLADMVTELDAARLLVYRAAYLKDAGDERSTREASEAKLFATEAAGRIIDQAVQIHGGSGLVRGISRRATVSRRARAAHLRRHFRNSKARHRQSTLERVKDSNGA